MDVKTATKTEPVPRLRLVIEQPQATGDGVDRQYDFDRAGGSIGSGPGDTWRLSSLSTGAAANHAEIRYIDGHFCLIDRSGQTYINSGREPVGRGRRARLQQGDRITLGRYRMKADFRRDRTAAVSFMADPSLDARLIEVQETELAQPATPKGSAEDIHTLVSLAQTDRAVSARAASDSTSETLISMDVEPTYLRAATASPGVEASRSKAATSTGSARAALLQALDADLDHTDEQTLGAEAGAALAATIRGLLTLHRNDGGLARGLRSRFHALDDNPLRLQQSYQATVNNLFAEDRSPVHLSASAAITESLQSLQRHDQATQAAISEALAALLAAFSPEALMRRFEGYRRGKASDDETTESAWAWQMYRHYHRELCSSRQRGFEALFREVFEQSYDQHIRQMTREGQL